MKGSWYIPYKVRIRRKGAFDYGYVSRPSQMYGKLEPFKTFWWAMRKADCTSEQFDTRKECLAWIKSWDEIGR